MFDLFLLMACNACVLVFMFLYLKARINKLLDIDSNIDRVKIEIGSLIAEMNAATDRNLSLIEDRITALKEQALLVDRKIALLNSETSKKQKSQETYMELSRVKKIEPETNLKAETQEEKIIKSNYEKAREELPLFDSVNESEKTKVLKTERIVSAPTMIMNSKSIPEKIIEMYAMGFSSEVISSKLGISVSEIELAINLEEQRALFKD